MTSNLKCPFCQKELLQEYNHGRDTVIYRCDNCFFQGDGIIWQALIQVKQDLVITTKALKEIRDETGEDRAGFSYVVLAMNMKETAENALKQIEHKDSK